MNDLFVIRYRVTETVGGVLSGITESGNFDYGYELEGRAFDVMLNAKNEKREDVGENEKDSHHTKDYAVVETKDGTKYEWWIDKIGVVRAGDR